MLTNNPNKLQCIFLSRKKYKFELMNIRLQQNAYIHQPSNSEYNQCFKYRISAIYRSAKLYTGYRTSGDLSRYGTKYQLNINSQYILDILKEISYYPNIK